LSKSKQKLSRRDALKAGFGLGAGALTAVSAVSGCGPMPNRCAGGPNVGADVAAGSLLQSIDTFVVVMLENRSFDNLLGGLKLDAVYPAAAAMDGVTGVESNPDVYGAPVMARKMTGNGTLDPRHDWASSRRAFNGGRNDGFVQVNAGSNQDETMGYYTREQLPFLHALASQYTVCDRWFSSVMGPTWPNRYYLHAGTATGKKTNVPMGLSPPPTIWQRLADRCWTGKNYHSGAIPWYSVAFPANSFSGDDAMVPEPMDHFYRDAAAGRLPNFALIDPDFSLNDGHPPHDLGLCEAFVASIYRSLADSPQWARTLLVITFDEHGGFFDHVAPPSVVDPDPDFQQLGFRVPTIVAGPRVRRGAVVSTTFEHVSIPATLAARFGIGSLGPRMDASHDLSSCLDPAAADGALALAAAPSLPIVALSASRSLRAPMRASSVPELARAARAGRVPAAHIDVRSDDERVHSWLRHAQELEAIRVIG
jgi:phospholipase C